MLLAVKLGGIPLNSSLFTTRIHSFAYVTHTHYLYALHSFPNWISPQILRIEEADEIPTGNEPRIRLQGDENRRN